ncbi:MAG: PIN domain-containing protein, partial [Candidatus Aminicenantes bacterium]|nr:PIN domain-containing protein [Candidatus Aminicenantes bacterium]
MNDRYLIDTSVWIFALRTKYVPKIKSYVERLLDEDKVVINPIIKLELLAGTKTRNEFARLKLRLDALQEIFIDQEIWEESQNIAFDLRRKGIKIPNIDIIILSCAKIHKITLVH